MRSAAIDPVSYRSQRNRALRIRLARPADQAALSDLLTSLSSRTVERRYFRPGRLGPEAARRESERLAHTTTAHHVLVAELCDGSGAVVAVAELACQPGAPGVAESAIVVTDAFQGEGIGRAIAEQLGQVARAAALTSIHATVRADNIPVRRLIASLSRPYTLRTWHGETQIVFAVSDV